MSHLRRLAVWVDEADHGNFHWVLHESTEEASVWLDIDSSAETFASWMDAFDAGCVALFKLVPDERTGPLAPPEDEYAMPVG